jgi:hypothetical protein
MSRKFVSLMALGLLLMITGSAGAQVGAGNVLIEEWFTANTGQQVNNDVTTLHTYIDSGKAPDKSYWATKLDRPDGGEDYWGGRMRGYIIPPETGDYTFWTASDDDSEVWLSTDEDPANATMICNVEGWMNYQDWTYTSGSPGTTYKSAPIPLEAGKRYYVDVFFSDGTGGGFDTVAWGGPASIGAGPVVVAGKYLSAFIRDPEPLFKAQNPDPANGAVDVTSPLFQWTAGAGAVAHEVYFGTTPDLAGVQPAVQPIAMYFHVAGLTPGTKYYWRVDEVDGAGNKVTGDVWSVTAMPLTAHAPSPADGALLKGTGPAPKLSWTAGQNTVSHNVYFGTDKALVTAADAGVAVAMAQATTSFDPGALQGMTTYYWRVDEVDSAGAAQAGAVWSFRITDKATDTNTDVWAIGAGAAGAKFVKTYVADGVYDIGTFGDEQTYEFVVRGNPAEQEPSQCLIGRRDVGDTKVGLKYEQWNNTKTYGATVFGVADYDFKVPNAPGEYTHLVFVSSKAGAKTDLYVNGELKGSVATAISLSGQVGIGYGLQNRPPAAPMFDNFDGDIFGVAIYDKALSAEEIAANADKYFNPITITDPDLLLYYDFEEGAGTIALDESGHSNHGLFFGQASWATGLFGGCVSLNSATGDYVETAGPLNIVSNTVSVTGWAKHDNTPTGWSGILTHRGTSPGCLGLQNNGSEGPNGAELKYMWGADQYWQFTSGLVIPNGEWYFAALTISPTQGKLYLNGVDQTATNVAEHVPTNFDKVISVGRDVGFGTNRLLTGMLDEVRLYNRTLTDVDIQRFVLADVTGPGDAIQPVPNYAGASPAAEPVANAIDDTSAKKYLNFANSGGSAGKAVMPTGLQVTPSVGLTIVTGLTLTTANDDYGRDPIKFELSGSNDSIDGPWTPIAAGDITDFAGATTWPRFTSNATAISFANTVAYKHYQLLFTAVRDPAAANSMQIGEIELLGIIAEPANMLPNGGFETGVIAPYGIYGTATSEVVTDCVGADVPEGPVEGKYCLHVVVPAAGANFWDVGMTDGSYTFKAGKKYKFSAWIKSKSGTMQVNMKPERSADPWEGYGDAIQTVTDKWQEFSVTTPVFTADVTPASPTFHFAFTACEFWMDNIKLQELEP